MHQEFEPLNKTQTLIESIWTFSSEGSTHFKVLPDSCVDLILDLNQNRGLVSGYMTRFQELTLPEETNVIGVRFQAESFAAFSSIPLSAFKNSQIEFADLQWSSNLLYLLNESSSLKERFSLIDNFICNKQNENTSNRDDLISRIVETIRMLQGKIGIKEIAQSHLISVR